MNDPLTAREALGLCLLMLAFAAHLAWAAWTAEKDSSDPEKEG